MLLWIIEAIKITAVIIHPPMRANRLGKVMGCMRPAMRRMECVPIYKVRISRVMELINAVNRCLGGGCR